MVNYSLNFFDDDYIQKIFIHFFLNPPFRLEPTILRSHLPGCIFLYTICLLVIFQVVLAVVMAMAVLIGDCIWHFLVDGDFDSLIGADYALHSIYMHITIQICKI